MSEFHPKGCCKTIVSYLDKTKQIQNEIKNADTVEKQVEVVINSLKIYSDMLSSHRISDHLTIDFRINIEPSLNEVWTKTDILKLIARLFYFGYDVEKILLKWKKIYCKNKKEETIW